MLQKAYDNPGLGRALVRLDTLARVTFTRLLRGRWVFVASSSTSVSELSVWEILNPSTCELRTRVYLRGPVLDGLVDDGREYVRLAITIGTSQVFHRDIIGYNLMFMTQLPKHSYFRNFEE